MENCLGLRNVATLRHRLDNGGPLSLGEASVIMDKIAEILDCLHLKGEIHGAVNPGNILLLPENQVQLLLPNTTQKALSTAALSGRTFAGDTLYLSPEEARGKPGTATTDIWGLGALLYEMLTGFPPFVALRLCTLRELVIGSEPDLLPQASASAQSVVDRALAKWPANRFVSAQDLANNLWAAVPAQKVPGAAPAAQAQTVVSLQQAVNRPFNLSPTAPRSDPAVSGTAGTRRWMRFFGIRRQSPGAAA